MLKKKILLMTSAVFLCILQGLAQKTISKADFESLVDYANCKYVMTFIEKNDADKSYFKDTYKKKVKPELEKSTLNDLGSVSYQAIIQLLQDNVHAQELAKKINERKSKYDDSSDDTDLINSLGAEKWKGVDLSDVASNIQNEISANYSQNYNESHVQKSFTTAQEQDLQANTKQLQDQYESLKNKVSWLNRIALGVLALLVIVLVFIFKMIKGRESIIEIVLSSQRIKEQFSPKTVVPNTNFSKSYILTEKDINIIVDKVQECLRLNEKEIKQSIEPMGRSSNTFVSMPQTTFKYLKGKTGKTFSRVENTPENSFFRLSKEYGDTADFEFSGNEEEAIAKRVFHDDICNILSGNYQNAHSVKMFKPGKVKRVGEQWTVTEPIEIILA